MPLNSPFNQIIILICFLKHIQLSLLIFYFLFYFIMLCYYNILLYYLKMKRIIILIYCVLIYISHIKSEIKVTNPPELVSKFNGKIIKII